MFVIYLIHAIAGYYLLVKRSKDYLNPFAISWTVWFSGAALSQIRLSELISPWCIKMHFVTLLFGYTIVICCLFCTKKAKKPVVTKPNNYVLPKSFKKISSIFNNHINYMCFIGMVYE